MPMRLAIRTIAAAAGVALMLGAITTAGGSEASAAPADTKLLVVGAAALVPTTDDWNYSNAGDAVTAVSGTPEFLVPLEFPVDRVLVKKVVFHAVDFDVGQVCVEFRKLSPGNQNEDGVGPVCSTDQPFRTAQHTINVFDIVGETRVPYLWVSVTGDAEFVAATVKYEVK